MGLLRNSQTQSVWRVEFDAQLLVHRGLGVFRWLHQYCPVLSAVVPCLPFGNVPLAVSKWVCHSRTREVPVEAGSVLRLGRLPPIGLAKYPLVGAKAGQALQICLDRPVK